MPSEENKAFQIVMQLANIGTVNKSEMIDTAFAQIRAANLILAATCPDEELYTKLIGVFFDVMKEDGARFIKTLKEVKNDKAK